ncbi:MAG: TetR family transcriptional regulator [Sphingomonadaceae bacterium]
MKQQALPAQDSFNRLIVAAVGKFAALGLEGTSTRDIAREANVALSAISYHFGSKTDLYRAAVQHAVDWMVTPLEATLAKAQSVISSDPSRDEIVDMLIELTGAVADIMLAPGEEGEAATQLAIRELVIPNAAKDIVAKGVVEPIVAYAATLLQLLDIPGYDRKQIAVEATVLFGPITVYRILNNHDFGAMGIAEARAIQESVRRATRRNIMALIESESRAP